MLAKKALEHGINVGIELRRLRKRFGARVGFESSVTNRQCECSRGQPRFAQPLAGLLREVAERRGHFVAIVGVFSKRVIVRDGLWFRIDHKFVRIAAARFAVERLAPLPENPFQLFLGNRRKLLDGFQSQRAQGSLGDFADARNLSHRERR